MAEKKAPVAAAKAEEKKTSTEAVKTEEPKKTVAVKESAKAAETAAKAEKKPAAKKAPVSYTHLVLEGLRADRTRQFFFRRECKVVCGNQQAGVCAGGDLVCGNSVPRGKTGAWTGISDIYDSAHFYQCGDRGACSGAVPSDLQVVRDEAGCGTDNIGPVSYTHLDVYKRQVLGILPQKESADRRVRDENRVPSGGHNL